MLKEPTNRVLGFYPETGEWKSVAWGDCPSMHSLAIIAKLNPSCTMLSYDGKRIDCATVLALDEANQQKNE